MKIRKSSKIKVHLLVLAVLMFQFLTGCVKRPEAPPPEIKNVNSRTENTLYSFENDGSLEKWKFYGGEWKSEKNKKTGNTYLTQANKDSVTFCKGLATDFTFSDFDLSVKIRPISGEDDQTGGVIFRAKDFDNGYMARINGQRDNLRLYKFTNGKRRYPPIEAVPLENAPPLSAWTTLNISCKGDKIRVGVNGKYLIDIQDDSYKSGMVGLLTKNDSKTDFDDLIITPDGSVSAAADISVPKEETPVFKKRAVPTREEILALYKIPLPENSDETQKKTNEALKKAMVFLVQNQSKNNFSWGNTYSVGVTALALQGLCRNSPTWRSLKNSETKRVVDYLLGHLQASGAIYDVNEGMANYCTSIALSTLSMLNQGELDEYVSQLQKFLLNNQNDSTEGLTEKNKMFGGSSYGPGDGDGADLSLTAFSIEALHDSNLPPDHPYWAKVRVFLKRCQGLHIVNDLVQESKFPEENKTFVIPNDGGFTYGPVRTKASVNKKRNDGKLEVPTYGSMTYQGLKSLIYAGVSKNDIRVKAAWDWISSHYTLENNPGLGVKGRENEGQQGLYYYYLTMAKCLDAFGEEVILDSSGKKHFWRRELVSKLLEKQRKDGSWVNLLDRRWQEKDPLLTTSYVLSTLAICMKNWDRLKEAEKGQQKND